MHSNFYTGPFTHRCLYSLYTEKLLHTETSATKHTFTHSQLLHGDAVLPLLDHLPFVFPSQVLLHVNESTLTQLGKNFLKRDQGNSHGNGDGSKLRTFHVERGDEHLFMKAFWIFLRAPVFHDFSHPAGPCSCFSKQKYNVFETIFV